MRELKEILRVAKKYLKTAEHRTRRAVAAARMTDDEAFCVQTAVRRYADEVSTFDRDQGQVVLALLVLWRTGLRYTGRVLTVWPKDKENERLSTRDYGRGHNRNRLHAYKREEGS